MTWRPAPPQDASVIREASWVGRAGGIEQIAAGPDQAERGILASGVMMPSRNSRRARRPQWSQSESASRSTLGSRQLTQHVTATTECDTSRVRERSLQEAHYGSTADYVVGSPHLQHTSLRTQLSSVLRAALLETYDRGLPLRVLEVGAGHGGYTEVALALGAHVTAVEMSRPSLDTLLERFRTNPKLMGRYDPDGTLADVSADFSVVLAVSVLHHIPDYTAFLAKASDLLVQGGTLVTLQDPLWYARMPKRYHWFDRMAYLAWRSRRGNVSTGLASVSRRIFGRLDETKPGDMVEYHVVRRGVDESSVQTVLRDRYRNVQLLRYWSNQSAIAQRLGDRRGWANTFGVVAHDLTVR